MNGKAVNVREAVKFMKKYNKEIDGLYKDKNKMADFLIKINKKFKKIKFLKEYTTLIIEMKTIINLLTDWKNGFYTEISPKIVYALIGGLIYFFMPFDLIFDGIPFLGYTDDMFVVSYVFKKFFHEIEKYKLWRENRLNENTLNVEI